MNLNLDVKAPLPEFELAAPSPTFQTSVRPRSTSTLKKRRELTAAVEVVAQDFSQICYCPQSAAGQRTKLIFMVWMTAYVAVLQQDALMSDPAIRPHYSEHSRRVHTLLEQEKSRLIIIRQLCGEISARAWQQPWIHSTNKHVH